MTEKLTHTPDYRDFITELKEKVQATQIKAARAVNTELIALYWAIGRRIEEAQEWEVETALMEHLTQFMLELGKGFAFVGRQYPLNVGGEDFYVDLLFYHLKLHCYIALELKTGAFKPEYAGKLNFYLTAIDEQVKTPEDQPSIGLILCKDRNQVIAEYALRDMKKPIRISRYELVSRLPEDLKTSLPTIKEVEAEFGEETKTGAKKKGMKMAYQNDACYASYKTQVSQSISC